MDPHSTKCTTCDSGTRFVRGQSAVIGGHVRGQDAVIGGHGCERSECRHRGTCETSRCRHSGPWLLEVKVPS